MSQGGRRRIDRDHESGARAAHRLETDRIGWLTTVAEDRTPQASPIWFLWDGEEFLVYSLDSPRVRNLGNHPRVSLNLDGNGLGGDIVIVEGSARVDPSMPSASDNPAYLEKYRSVMDDYGWTPEWFAGRYSVPVRITPTRFRYW
ncbi:MAG: TIGR03667 family PPOX class F420-dependent oxidoreductase [Actinomycetota bacterium]